MKSEIICPCDDFVVGSEVFDDVDASFDVGCFHSDHHKHEELTTQERSMLENELMDQIEMGRHAFETIMNMNHADLVEVCAPWDSPLCQAVRDLGGTAVALGHHNGFDLNTMEGYKNALAVIGKLRPRYVHISPPCYLWSPFQNCAKRTPQQLIQFQKGRNVSRKLISRCCRILEVQIYELNGHGSQAHDTDDHEHHGGGEHPLAAQSWSRWLKNAVVGSRYTDAAMGCSINPSNSSYVNLGDGLPRNVWFGMPWRACHHPVGTHRKIEGAITPTTATYPVILCRRFAKAILKSEVSDNMFHSILASDQVANQEIAAGSDAGEQGHDH